MWRLLSGISGASLLEQSDNAQRQTNWRNFLTVNDLWMYDVLQEYKRKNGKETSASDSDIEEFDLTDFRLVFAAKLRINKVAFTSQQAASWTFQKLSDSASGLGARYKPQSLAGTKSVSICNLTRSGSHKNLRDQDFVRIHRGSGGCVLYFTHADQNVWRHERAECKG